MDTRSTIVLTGAAGFIGSCLAGCLNEQGFRKLILVDDFGRADKLPNWEQKTAWHCVDRSSFFAWLEKTNPHIDFFFHLGARTDTTEFDYGVLQLLNVEYSQSVWRYCSLHRIPLVYASSAATYGDGSLGYSDRHEIVSRLRPLNPYGQSKNVFDQWALDQAFAPPQSPDAAPPCWAGLKFFNVYGPNEYHKGRMASVAYHSFRQIGESGQVMLFRSHRPDFRDGEQLRDFVYVKDLLKVCCWLMESMTGGGWTETRNGLFNLGTGKARTFADLASAVFTGLSLAPQIIYIDMPDDLRNSYQYFTEAEMGKIREAGYPDDFYSLESGISDYVRNYLALNKFL